MEKPVSFKNGNDVLRGILHSPDDVLNEKSTGVIFLHGWSGCRLGPHRMFVKTARRLTGLGCYCLRFDFSDRGESDGNTDEASIQSMISDTKIAVDFMLADVPVNKIILLGICSGCKVGMALASGDSRINGLALWSAELMGELRDSAVNARKSLFTLKDYLKKLCSVHTWRKILSFQVNFGLVGKAMFTQESPDKDELREESVWLDKFRSYRGKILFIYGSNDPNTKRATEEYSDFCKQAGLKNEFYNIKNSSHSFYSLEWEKEVIEITRNWLLQYVQLSQNRYS